MNASKLVELVIQNIPYPDQIQELAINVHLDCIEFTWRSARYRVSDPTLADVNEVQNGRLVVTGRALLMRTLLRYGQAQQAMKISTKSA